jgi:hypothetical protein
MPNPASETMTVPSSDVVPFPTLTNWLSAWSNWKMSITRPGGMPSLGMLIRAGGSK